MGRKNDAIFTDDQAGPIYDAFPRKVGREYALLCIRRALVRIMDGKKLDGPKAVEWLLCRVQTYAKASAGNEKRYVPHCATFMNQGRYDDDDHEWSSWKKNATVAPDKKVAVSAVQGEIDAIKNTMASGSWNRMDPRWKAIYEDRLKELGG